MKYKLICFDLDGTLLRHDFSLPQEYIAEFAKLKALGYRLTIATGRNYEGAKSYTKLLGIEEPMIFSNGCQYQDPREKEQQILFGIPKEAALVVADLQRDFDLSIKLHMGNGSLYKSKDMPWPHEVTHFPIGEVREDLADIITDDPIKIVAHGKPAEMDRFKEAVLAALPQPPAIRLFRSHEYYLEITNVHVSKGAALAKLIGMMGIQKEEVVTLGDHENDYEMLKGFGLGIQVGENCPKLAEVADFQLKGPEELGLLGLAERLG